MDGRWVEVGDGVLARRYTELDLTVGLVVGGERALVIDTRGDVRQGAELAAAVRAATALPLVVAITHAHFDHCFGTAAFLPAPVHALRRCREVLTGTAAEQRATWEAHYRGCGDEITADALAVTDPSLPDAPAPVDLDLGGRVVALRHLGRGHTDHDMVVHVPDAGVVFAGDLVEQGAPPAFEDAVVPTGPARSRRCSRWYPGSSSRVTATRSTPRSWGISATGSPRSPPCTRPWPAATWPRPRRPAGPRTPVCPGLRSGGDQR